MLLGKAAGDRKSASLDLPLRAPCAKAAPQRRPQGDKRSAADRLPVGMPFVRKRAPSVERSPHRKQGSKFFFAGKTYFAASVEEGASGCRGVGGTEHCGDFGSGNEAC